MDGERYMEYEVYTNDLKKILYIKTKKNLDSKWALAVNKFLFPIILKYNLENIVLDLKKIKKITPAGYNMLYKLKWASKITKSRLILKNVSEDILNDLKKINFRCRKEKLKVGV